MDACDMRTVASVLTGAKMTQRRMHSGNHNRRNRFKQHNNMRFTHEQKRSTLPLFAPKFRRTRAVFLSGVNHETLGAYSAPPPPFLPYRQIPTGALAALAVIRTQLGRRQTLVLQTRICAGALV